MSTKELLEIEIYPALYSHIEQDLTEFKIKRTAGGYNSTAGLKLVKEAVGSKFSLKLYKAIPGR